MNKRPLDNYLGEIAAIHERGDAREETFYPALEKLIRQVAHSLDKSVDVTMMPKKTEAGNPDFRIWDGQAKIIGYIEAKRPETDLDDVEKSEQVQRYLDTFPNLILTNFLEFRFYRDKLLIDRVSIGRQHTLVKVGTKPVLENPDQCRQLLEKFLSFTFPRGLDARKLALELAKRTQFLRDQVVIEELKEASPDSHNPILGYFQVFKKYLIIDLTVEGFADYYSQTITYGLFAARTRCTGEFHRKNAIDFIPQTIGLLHDLFDYISLGQPPEQFVWIIDDISEVLASVDVQAILNQFYREGKGEDPIVHFYETFLGEYDPRLREKRGVYYTPESVVSFIVRTVNQILKEKFDRPDGLADLHIKVLDPAAGTLTFITEAAKLALEEYTQKYGQGGKESFIRSHLLENFYAFELMMAPYAIGHLKMSYILEEMGFKLPKDERFKLYLTNTLEMEDIEQSDIPGIATLSAESRLAGKVKKQAPILVILGNPPYSGHSSNIGAWISAEIRKYYRVDGKPLNEKNPKWLQDDYVKFIRFAQWKIDQNGEGVLGFITNHSYLDNPTFRGMRQSLMKSFDEIFLLDLHGNALKKERCPDASKDENVFDIRQGVAIALMIKKKKKAPATNECLLRHADLWGLREEKYSWLKNNDKNTVPWQTLNPKPEFYLFTPRNESLENEYRAFVKITDIFPVYSVGIVTARDDLTIHETPEKVSRTVTHFSSLPPEDARAIYNLGPDARDWQVQLAQQDLIASGLKQENIVPILYRPFDTRYTYYTGISRGFLCRPRPEVMKNMINDNLGLIFHRREELKIKYAHFLITDNIIEHCCLSIKTTCYISPLYIYPDKAKKDLFSHLGEDQDRRPNIHTRIYDLLRKASYKPSATPEQIFYYIYAVLYSNTYRDKYAEFLKTDFPRIPFTREQKLFIDLGQWGKKLADTHLLKAPELEQTFARFEGQGDSRVEKVKYAEELVWINDRQYFSAITPEIWAYQVGGYQVMNKWLKDRKGRALTLQDIRHYIRIARALQLTIDYQHQIDALYPQVEFTLIPS